MPDPGQVLIKPQNTVPFIRNNATSEEIAWWRVQRIDPVMRRDQTSYFQLGQKGSTGTTVDSPEFTITVEHNMHDMRAELVLAGKDPDVDTSYNLGDVLDQENLRVNLLERRALDLSNWREYEYDEGVVASLTWAFAVRTACTTTTEIRATLGKLYASGGSLPHTGGSDAFPQDTTTTPGAVLGKDARVRFGTDSPPNRAYRLQSFNIRAAIPIDVTRELGRRNIVGVTNRQPTVTIDMDVLTADQQPHNVWFQANAGPPPYIDFTNTNELDLFVRIYDPDLAEANTVLRAWKIENARPGDVTPMSIAVGGQPATRYSFQLGAEDTTGAAGVICYLGDIP